MKGEQGKENKTKPKKKIPAPPCQKCNEHKRMKCANEGKGCSNFKKYWSETRKGNKANERKI